MTQLGTGRRGFASSEASARGSPESTTSTM
jgi:hypothetical protein